MELCVNNKVCIVYDTFVDMINDSSIVENTVVMTLGYKDVNDGNGRLYKIITKNEKGLRKLEGRSFGKNSPLFAMEIINPSVTDTLKELSSKVEELSKTVMNFKQPKTEKDNAFILHKINLNDEGTVKVVKLYNNLTYIVNTGEVSSKVVKEIEITEESKWIIPTDFILSEFKITEKKVGSYITIKYAEGKLTFTINFAKLKTNVIHY